MIKVLQMNERLVREMAERKRCLIIYGVKEKTIALSMKREREMNLVKNVQKTE